MIRYILVYGCTGHSWGSVPYTWYVKIEPGVPLPNIKQLRELIGGSREYWFQIGINIISILNEEDFKAYTAGEDKIEILIFNPLTHDDDTKRNERIKRFGKDA